MAGVDNADANSNNIIFTIKDTKSYVLVLSLSAKHNQKLSKLLSEGLKIAVYWNEHKTKKYIGMNIKQKVRVNFVKVNFVTLKLCNL